jgi:hypothetical protein
MPAKTKTVPLRAYPGWQVNVNADGTFAASNSEGVTGPARATFQEAVAWVRSRTRNPWVALHMDAEMLSTGEGYTRSMARALVLSEFANGPDPMDCEAPGCNGVAWYRATVGALMCPDCRSLYHCNGEPI